MYEALWFFAGVVTGIAIILGGFYLAIMLDSLGIWRH